MLFFISTLLSIIICENKSDQTVAVWNNIYWGGGGDLFFPNYSLTNQKALFHKLSGIWPPRAWSSGLVHRYKITGSLPHNSKKNIFSFFLYIKELLCILYFFSTSCLRMEKFIFRQKALNIYSFFINNLFRRFSQIISRILWPPFWWIFSPSASVPTAWQFIL